MLIKQDRMTLTMECSLALKRTLGDRNYTGRCGCVVMNVMDNTTWSERVINNAMIREPADLLSPEKVKSAAVQCNRTGNRWSVR